MSNPIEHPQRPAGTLKLEVKVNLDAAARALYITWLASDSDTDRREYAERWDVDDVDERVKQNYYRRATAALEAALNRDVK